MKLINSGLEILEQQPGLDGIYKQIELAGRTCYKSEDKITEDSAKSFVDRMVKSGHGAILEHGTVYLHLHITVKESHDDNIRNGWIDWAPEFAKKYRKNPYSKILLMDNDIYVTTNYRVLVENNWLDDLKYLCEPTEYHAKRVTVKFVCDRGVSHEFVRHRIFSFAQESTRYCNYSKDKFDNELTFIIPSWTNLPEGKYTNWDNDWCDVAELKLLYPEVDNIDDPTNCFLQSIKNAEFFYITAINNGWKAQQARQILPNALKTELVMTGFLSDWTHFFELRCAPSAHPDAQKLAKELLVKLHEMHPGKFDELYNKYYRNEN